MTYPEIHFDSISAERPTRETLAAGYAAIHRLLDAQDRAGALAAFDSLRRGYETWSSLVYLRFEQNTADAAAKADQDYADALNPEATRLEIEVKRRLLGDPDQPGLAALAGLHALRLWQTDILTFDPTIVGSLEQEAQLASRYTALLAAAAIPFRGEICNLSALEPFAEDPDRAIREAAVRARWAFYEAHAEELDSVFDELVRLRHGMAMTLGYRTYTPLGYRRMRRVDYDAADVARYRDQVAEHVVPLVADLLAQRTKLMGWGQLRFWDEALIDPAGNPKPAGDHDFLVGAAQGMFDELDPRLGAFYRAMRAGGLMDLQNRSNKAGGGFCTSFPTIGMPFIFANFNGTHGDLNVFTHEMGHAFQNAESRALPGIDYLWPTSESAEINSMALEFLTYPVIGRMVGDAEAARFRRMHLIGALSFLPYGVCVDHFQHEVYENPDASPGDRHEMWKALEARYMPWTDYGDIGFLGKGGRWQAKPHIYRSPFYYIDYTLAQCCALQFWHQAQSDPADAMNRYVALCGRGGSAPFQDLVQSAGLTSPFAPGALAGVVQAAAHALGVA
jgi:M3 family oligoendopeptidase